MTDWQREYRTLVAILRRAYNVIYAVGQNEIFR